MTPIRPKHAWANCAYNHADYGDYKIAQNDNAPQLHRSAHRRRASPIC